MRHLFFLAAILCFGMAAIKFCTARMKPNNTPVESRPAKLDDGVLTPEQAKARMEENPDLILLDVRTQEEFEQGHIPGAVCLPNEMIAADMPFLFGRRSADAAKKLRDMGFTNVFDFGGIIDWPYETTTD